MSSSLKSWGKGGTLIMPNRIGDSEFGQIQVMMYEHVGIVLQNNKKALVEARVNKRLRALQIPTYTEYLRYLATETTGQELIQLIDAISTNVTQFFREADHFDFMSEIVGKWLDEGRTKLRFWSAASSTGEEPYTMAMILKALPQATQTDIRILGTDISSRVLKIAAKGVYTPNALEKMSTATRERYFDPVRIDGDSAFRIKPALKEMVLFKRMNLNRTPYRIKTVFDIIFCRNVMIYFDKELRDRIVAEAYRLLKPGGYLIIGHAETLIGMDRKFSFVRPSVYRRS